MPEKYFTIPELARETGFSAAYIRAACNRGSLFHPLPHVSCGAVRPIARICLSDWVKWLNEEKAY